MINKIWGFFIIIGIMFSVINGNLEQINIEILDSAKVALDMVVKILPVMALWLGIMNIASKSGLLEKFSRLLSPILTDFLIKSRSFDTSPLANIGASST